MAFVKAVIELKPTKTGTGIKASLKKARAASARLTVILTPPTAKDLGFGTGDKFEILMGEGEHHGLLRFRKNNSVGIAELTERKAAHGSAYLALPLGVQGQFVNRTESAAWCQWEKVEEGWVEVVLPRWADESRPAGRALEIRAAPPVQVRTPPARHGTSVTASLMGDPPPGRRQAMSSMDND